jgi:hypothetical protein
LGFLSINLNNLVVAPDAVTILVKEDDIDDVQLANEPV